MIKAALCGAEGLPCGGGWTSCREGVIVHNKTAAQYFQQIFLHDWQHLAKQATAPD
jgi:hypothetical protein